MTKTKFTGALSQLLDTDKEDTQPKEKKAKALLTGEIRATIIVDSEKMEKMKNIAFHHKLLIKDVVDSAFEKYIKEYEKKHGKVEGKTDKKLPI